MRCVIKQKHSPDWLVWGPYGWGWSPDKMEAYVFSLTLEYGILKIFPEIPEIASRFDCTIEPVTFQ